MLPHRFGPTPRRWTRIALIALAVVVVVGACGGGDDDPSAGPAAASDGIAVAIKTFAFQPDPLTVEAGTTVTWTNQDDILHTVTSGTRSDPDGTFDQKLDGPASKATFTFDTAGTFAYHCSIHPGMDASVEVS